MKETPKWYFKRFDSVCGNHQEKIEKKEERMFSKDIELLKSIKDYIGFDEPFTIDDLSYIGSAYWIGKRWFSYFNKKDLRRIMGKGWVERVRRGFRLTLDGVYALNLYEELKE